jgi:GH43 family beta-xylosidase
MSRALLWAVLLVSTVSSAQTFTNPILGETSADPSIVQYNGYYYHAFSDGSQRIFVRKSATLTGIGSAPAVQVWLAPTTGAYSRETWAPELQLIQGRWYIYFAASDGNNANHRMFVLESTSLDPQGAYVFKGQPDRRRTSGPSTGRSSRRMTGACTSSGPAGRGTWTGSRTSTSRR